MFCIHLFNFVAKYMSVGVTIGQIGHASTISAGSRNVVPYTSSDAVASTPFLLFPIPNKASGNAWSR